jgi:hypothetical protein
VQLIEQGLRLFQIECIEAFDEPVIDRSEKIAGLIPFVLIALEPRHAHRRRSEHGVTAIEKVRQERPADYLKIIASIIPKELHVKEQSLEDMSDEELFATIDSIRSLIPADRKH